jgi:hypothetical protein
VLDENISHLKQNVMAKVHGVEFKRQAVRIALSGWQQRQQIAADLGNSFLS